MIDNTSEIDSGLIKKLFDLANLDINMINDPKYKNEVETFINQESSKKVLKRLSKKHTHGHPKRYVVIERGWVFVKKNLKSILVLHNHLQSTLNLAWPLWRHSDVRLQWDQ